MLDPEDKKQIKENFNEWLDIYEQRAELTKQIADLKKATAVILDVESSIVTKLFSHLKKLYEDATDELGELKSIVDELQS